MFAAATVERNKRSASSLAQGERAQQRAAAALESLTDTTISCLNSSVSRIFRKQTEINTLVTKLEVRYVCALCNLTRTEGLFFWGGERGSELGYSSVFLLRIEFSHSAVISEVVLPPVDIRLRNACCSRP